LLPGAGCGRLARRKDGVGHVVPRAAYVTRPAIAEKRLSLTNQGKVRYELKTPYRDGTTHVIFEPLDFIARLAALVPKPRVNLTRFHGVFAPNSTHRSQVTPARRGRGNQPKATGKEQQTTPTERHVAMSWAQRLKRVFNIDIDTCSACGGESTGGTGVSMWPTGTILSFSPIKFWQADKAAMAINDTIIFIIKFPVKFYFNYNNAFCIRYTEFK
jgi:hypothetical protein